MRHRAVLPGPRHRAHRGGHHAQLHHPPVHARDGARVPEGDGGRDALDRHPRRVRGGHGRDAPRRRRV